MGFSLKSVFGGGGGKVPQMDFNKLKQISEAGATTQKNLITQRLGELGGVTNQFKTGREALSARIPQESENLLQRYGQELSGVGALEKSAGELASRTAQEQAFRDVPAIQRAIKAQLGGTGLLKSGAAATALANPLTSAYQSAADFTRQNELMRLQNETARREGLAKTGLDVRGNAIAQRLGLDEGTINTLKDIGREDLISKFSDLAGIENTRTNQLLGYEQAAQQQAIAKAQADAARKGSLLSNIGSIGGTVIGGVFGGPVGAGIGGQLGGMLGNVAGGGSGGQFDPTLVASLFKGKAAPTAQLMGGNGRSIPVAPSNYYKQYM